ncbi:MAG: hypothetical protein RBT62_01785 [Spirochaetia bacterium]|jgi:hypothetical protein|nr:hypothetical protein [Spirochaetia bacterium]
MTEKLFEKFPDGGLIKTVDEPNGELSSEQKVQLNRRGNVLFNNGDVESARRIFQTTGYSDGLMRVGESYLGTGRPIDALKMFKLSHDTVRSAALIEKAAFAVREMLNEKEE